MLDRRTFLQQGGLALLTLGLNPIDRSILPLANSYLQTLAATNNRKLALLIGINDYHLETKLNGCLTDVELQKELLIYRFGFLEEDVLLLTGNNATRENIETAFVEHLTKQAKATDVVVFHFSGYGGLVSQGDNTSSWARALIPVDGLGNYILENTLQALGQTLATNKVTMILDTSYHTNGKSMEGNLRLRSCPYTVEQKSDSQELIFKEGLLLKQRSSPLMLEAAKGDQMATETTYSGFSAGLFTYSLTQYLWQTTPASTAVTSVSRSAQTVETITGKKQEPNLQGGNKPALTFYLSPSIPEGAEGVVTMVEENGIVHLQLTGLPSWVVSNYAPNSCFKVVDERGTILQVLKLQGLTAKCKILYSTFVPKGQLVQEWLRLLPRNVKLTIALGTDFEKIERVDATSALSGVSTVAAVVTAGEAADCLLAKVPEIGGYGLFSVGGLVIPGTKGTATEALKAAIYRLSNHLNILLATKLWRLTINEGSSQLAVKAYLEVAGTKDTQVLVARETQRQTKEPNSSSSGTVPVVKIGTQIQCRVINQGDVPLHVMLLGIDSDGSAIALYCPQSSTTDGNNSFLEAGETLVIPRPNNSLGWLVTSSTGITEVIIICSIAPFSKTLETLHGTQKPKGDKEQIVDLVNPLEVSRSLLQDLHISSGVKAELIGANTELYALDVNAWSTFHFVYAVEEATI